MKYFLMGIFLIAWYNEDKVIKKKDGAGIMIIASINKIKKILLRELSPSLLFLFGSAVNGNFREGSDFDLAYLTAKDISQYNVYMIAQKLADLTGHEIDLIDLNKASTVLKAQIVGKGSLIYCSDQTFKANYIIRVLKEYALLNEERKEILERIKKEGVIYG